MAMKTPFSAEELTALLACYDLGEFRSFEPFEHGEDQTNLLLVTTRDRYAFRYYEKRSADYVSFEIDLLQHLAQLSYPSPAPVPMKSGDFIGEYNEKPFALFQFLEGEHSNDATNA